MSRYRLCAILAMVLCAVAYAFGRPNWCWLVLGIFVVLIGLGVAFPQLQFFGPFICRGNPGRREVALTFDDGPDARSTPALLDLLRQEKVPATFFCIGQRVAAERELTARLAREGHMLGNHTYHHSNLTNCFGPRRLREELQLTQAAIAAATGTPPRIFARRWVCRIPSRFSPRGNWGCAWWAGPSAVSTRGSLIRSGSCGG